jgi:sulfatase maturation enzyme AslB (radical SAM superfamily)
MLYFKPLFLGKKCNNDCDYCEVEDESCSEKTLDEIREEISKIDELLNVKLYGGEPTLRRDLENIVDTLKEKGVKRIKITTNGRALADTAFLHNLLEIGIWHYEIKINGPSPDIHDSITKTSGSFMETVNGLKNLRVSRISKNNKEPFVALKIRLAKNNVNGLFNTISFALNQNIDRIILSYDDPQLSYIDSAAVIKNAIEMCLFGRIWVRVEKIPYCMFSGYEYHLIRLKSPEHIPYTKILACKTCSYNFCCPGIWEKYLKYNNPKQFQSVSKIPYFKDLKELFDARP